MLAERRGRFRITSVSSGSQKGIQTSPAALTCGSLVSAKSVGSEPSSPSHRQPRSAISISGQHHGVVPQSSQNWAAFLISPTLPAQRGSSTSQHQNPLRDLGKRNLLFDQRLFLQVLRRRRQRTGRRLSQSSADGVDRQVENVKNGLRATRALGMPVRIRATFRKR